MLPTLTSAVVNESNLSFFLKANLVLILFTGSKYTNGASIDGASVAPT